MRFLFSISFLLFISAMTAQSCMARFSYEAHSEKVSFYNQSQVRNAHYFWNFGDGNGSNFRNPIHEFPDNGTYLVSLYIQDTITKCSSMFESWVEVNCASNHPCNPKISDSVFYIGRKPYYKIVENSENCGEYRKTYAMFGGTGLWWTVNELPDLPGNTLTCINYRDSVIRRQVYKTFPYKYDRSKNYSDCSANFEWRILEEDTGGQRILFSAMYKGAAQYRWAFSGFGDEIYTHHDTASLFFPYRIPRAKFPKWMSLIHLRVKDQNGCADSLYQRLTYRPMSVTTEGADIGEGRVTVYPTYVKDRFYIDIATGIQVNAVSIIDATGRTVLNIPPERREVDVSSLASGIYMVRIGDVKSTQTVKLIKE